MQLAESGLVVNPHVFIKSERGDGSINALTVRAPVRGQSLRVTKVTRSEDPEIFTALLIHSVTGSFERAYFSHSERNRLVEMGVLLAVEEISSPVFFSCDITALPSALIPERARRTTRPVEEVSDMIVNPTLRHLGSGGPTPYMRGRVKLPNAFATDRSWVVVDDAVTGIPSLYSYSQDICAAVQALRAGEPVSKTVAKECVELLYTAGIIESAAEGMRARAHCRQRRKAALTSLDQNRYVVMPHMLAPLQLAAIRQYYRSLIAQGFLQFGDTEWPNRYFSPHDPIAHFFHQQLTGLVSDIAGQPVKASFCFFASYYPGSALPAHRDREQCEWALSLPLDQSPEAETLPWPLFLQPPGAGQPMPIFTGVGDGTLYYGREVRHHRDALTAADYGSFWFLFYVPANFSGTLD